MSYKNGLSSMSDSKEINIEKTSTENSHVDECTAKANMINLSNIKLERVPFSEQLSKIEREWDELLASSTRPSIYASYHYINLSVKYFSHASEETFCLLMRDTTSGRLLAIFPMSIGIRKIRKKQVRVLEHCITTNHSDVDKPYPVIHNRYETECWTLFHRYFTTEYTNWDWLEYDELIPESKLNGLLKKLYKFPDYLARQQKGPVSPLVDLSGSWENFQQQHRNMRKKAKRMKKKLGDGFSYKVYNKHEDMSRCIDLYVSTESAGWKANKGVSENNNQKFYREVLPLLAKKGQVYFGILFDHDTPVSAEMSYVYLDTVYFAHGAFHPDYKHLSPGSVSTSMSIEYFHGKNYRDGDFLAGYADYVNPLAYKQDPTKDTVVFKVNYIFVYYLIDTFFRKTKSKLKRIMRRIWNKKQNNAD
ncbi:GNAT family N-acetyltransferase [Aliikangiella coralliicola]|uniref:GNAT family N-acetyltransferase n=1 Tax=Aliikangiella coralliicola TaxID=2592383 RepID=A0A545UH18_9GAMM|nr:GNAT family N-acetyltransferase [Aliikangiella coralliicola]TQV88713.1 GNAT family N-acetyltransferase [Aliikangiella coralliicola]